MHQEIAPHRCRKRTFGFIALCSALFIAIPGLTVIPQSTSDYVVIGWNNIGMHEATRDFSVFGLHPPFNTLKAQVVKKGIGSEKPILLTDGLNLSYEIPGNSYSIGKTNFWDYSGLLFGRQLEPDVGLTGRGLSGWFSLSPKGDHFIAEGIPVTPFSDFDPGNEDPYQLATVNLTDRNGNILAQARPVIPVSNEINCTACHGSDSNIVMIHPAVDGYDPSQPMLCAKCHASAIVGIQGDPRAHSLSEVIHRRHINATNDCYACHAGRQTLSLRGIMQSKMGLTCQDCHGNMANISDSIARGRRPWLDEPKCGTCHGPMYGEEPGKLYRNSKGHGGLYCSACHGTAHAILPSDETGDNQQNISLQGFEGTLQNCSVCHEEVPNGAGPHGKAH